MYKAGWQKPDLLGAGKGAGYSASMKARGAAIDAAQAASARLTANATSAIAALRDTGFTQEQIAPIKAQGRAAVVDAAVANTTWKPGTVSSFGKNPMMVYLAIAAGAAGLFYFAKKRKTARRKASR